MTRTFPALSALAIAAALAIAGCGGGSSSSSGEASGYGSGESTSSSKAASSESGGGSSSASGSGGSAVSVAGVSVGKVLVDSEGMTLYYFEKDQGGKSACYGACANAWPPLTTSGAPQAMGAANSSKLGTTKRTDGTIQVTYAGWPLYTYIGDSKPGEDNGTDVKAFGASWYPLHANGQKAGH